VRLCRIPWAVLVLSLASCGDLPQPFAGRPGAAALRLAEPPPARLIVPPPTGALLADHAAATWAQATTASLVASEVPAFALPSHKGDWQLQLSAELRGASVLPRYTLLDPAGKPRGDAEGVPVAAASWAAGDAAALQHEADASAPRIVDLLTSVQAHIAQSDPNSLYNRPARIRLTGVTGAPGDGNTALLRQMRAKIPDTGDLVVSASETADFLVRGTVRLTDEPDHQQQVEIHWIVTDLHGKEAGDVAQGHDFPHGALDGYWGDIAAAVADEAAGGVHQVITNFSGRKK
jgi:hypothetical protein